MSDDTTTAGGYPRGLRLSDAQDSTLRRWPMERIRPKSVALGVRSLFAEVDALRAENAALRARVEALAASLFEIRDYCAELHDGDDVERLAYRVTGMANGALNEYFAALAAAERAAPEGKG